MEFTFQHPHTDSRGARRYFTLASSPTEPQVRIGLRFYQPGSSFKRELLKITSQTPIVAGQLGGDFILPKDQQRKLVFIAGGIGITPFRSMLKYLVDTEQQRDVTLIYSARTSGDIVYQDVFNEARAKLGTKLHYFVGDPQAKDPFTNARITTASLQSLELDKDSLFYISGPHDMVVDTEKALHELGVPALHIRKDFFSGYA
jgi:ferredoxin-NADP reductase